MSVPFHSEFTEQLDEVFSIVLTEGDRVDTKVFVYKGLRVEYNKDQYTLTDDNETFSIVRNFYKKPLVRGALNTDLLRSVGG